MVATAFLENPSNLPVVNHLNGNKKDNRVSNLCWASISDNVAHAYATGLAKRGEESVHALLTDEKVREIASMFATHSIAEIARRFNVRPATISNIRNGNTWKHLGLACSASDKEKYKGNKLSVSDIPLIRQMIAEGYRDIDIAKRFGVHRGSIHGIRFGKNWKNY